MTTCTKVDLAAFLSSVSGIVPRPRHVAGILAFDARIQQSSDRRAGSVCRDHKLCFVAICFPRARSPRPLDEPVLRLLPSTSLTPMTCLACKSTHLCFPSTVPVLPQHIQTKSQFVTLCLRTSKDLTECIRPTSPPWRNNWL